MKREKTRSTYDGDGQEEPEQQAKKRHPAALRCGGLWVLRYGFRGGWLIHLAVHCKDPVFIQSTPLAHLEQIKLCTSLRGAARHRINLLPQLKANALVF
ncbi:hypothetical protein [Maritalea myrionectae]|uniref:hypothetical protein n=1 Tax=Maritalea myrionectae TaxID=454601 RepID=UPI0013C36F6A|nr:hypothetical protein [Maritalea myrionectae]